MTYAVDWALKANYLCICRRFLAKRKRYDDGGLMPAWLSPHGVFLLGLRLHGSDFFDCVLTAIRREVGCPAKILRHLNTVWWPKAVLFSHTDQTLFRVQSCEFYFYEYILSSSNNSELQSSSRLFYTADLRALSSHDLLVLTKK